MTLQDSELSHLAELPAGGDPTIDRLSMAMHRAYLAAGGVAGGDQVARMLREQSEEPVSFLARWIVSRQVVSFVWRSQIFLPLFQFDLSSMSLRPGVRQVMVELLSSFDDWELAHWFTLPNAWLDGAAPLEGISRDRTPWCRRRELIDSSRWDGSVGADAFGMDRLAMVREGLKALIERESAKRLARLGKLTPEEAAQLESSYEPRAVLGHS